MKKKIKMANSVKTNMKTLRVSPTNEIKDEAIKRFVHI
jgi:hypothetical protein